MTGGFPWAKVRAALAGWFARCARPLPWRDDPRPYHVLVSEFMLQQTRVQAVLQPYAAFLRRFPTLEALALAPQEQVLQAWSGLGYYRRARMLHAAARAMHEAGGIPAGAAELQQLPGIGPYTAGAIASIAFNQPAAIVDGNIERVFARWLRLEEDIRAAGTRKKLWQLAGDWVEHGNVEGLAPRALNQAMMELGAVVCTPRAPRCSDCPIRAHCRGRDVAESLPRLPPRKTPRLARYAAALVRDGRGRVLLVRRPEGDRTSLLPAALWELPHVKAGRGWPAGALEALLGAACKATGKTHTRRHSIMDWSITLCAREVRCEKAPRPALEHAWFTPARARSAAQSSATTKLLQAAGL